MTEQSALDEILDMVRSGWRHTSPPLRKTLGRGGVIASAISKINNHSPDCIPQALQDPRYIQHCKEQDRKEGVTILREVYHQGYRETWYSDGRIVEHKDGCKGDLIGEFDLECAKNNLGWNCPPGTFKQMQENAAKNI